MRNLSTFYDRAPSISIPRSRFDLSHNVKSGFNAGELVPLGAPIKVVPGDTMQIDLSSFVRMNPSINVPLDDCYLDAYFFFVPCRLVWEHWAQFLGENTASAWAPSTTYTQPKILINDCDDVHDVLTIKMIHSNDILSHFGLPSYLYYMDETYDKPLSYINAIPVRSYCLIWNEFFRDENVMAPLNIYKGDNVVQFVSGTDQSDIYLGSVTGGKLLPVCRQADYFSKALPDAQKGDPVRIPLSSDLGKLDVLDNVYSFANTDASGVKWKNTNTSNYMNFDGGAGVYTADPSAIQIIGSNLGVDITGLGGTINELRIAYQTQMFLEAMGRNGSRLTEIIKGMFGVTSSDARLQRPEYLGGTRFYIQMNSITNNTAPGEGGTPLGKAAGYSATANKGSICTKSFTEHGFIIPLICVRTNRSYAQGVDRIWTDTTYLDEYWPVFSRIGEQPIYKREIYAGLVGSRVASDEVFGYQEAWAHYRTMPNKNTGFLGGESSLAPYWTYTDYYASKPTLSADWMKEGKANLERNLAIASNETSSCQFIGDFRITCYATRPLPTYSIPSLSDHI